MAVIAILTQPQAAAFCDAMRAASVTGSRASLLFKGDTVNIGVQEGDYGGVLVSRMTKMPGGYIRNDGEERHDNQVAFAQAYDCDDTGLIPF